MMFRILLGACAFAIATLNSATAQENTVEATDMQTEEALAWDAVKDSTASADVFEFIQTYPDGAFYQQAQTLMVDLLWQELQTAEQAKDQTPEAPAETGGTAPASEEVIAVTFQAPLTQGAPEIVGKSIEELIAGNPLFPPVEGIPASLWENEECSACHDWEQANLCDQANTYLTEAGSENLTKQHPYGGTFKENLARWATGGCE